MEEGFFRDYVLDVVFVSVGDEVELRLFVLE